MSPPSRPDALVPSPARPVDGATRAGPSPRSAWTARLVTVVAAVLVPAATAGAAVAIRGALTRAPLTPEARDRTALVVTAVLVGWLLVATTASYTRTYRRSARPGVLMIIVPVAAAWAALAGTAPGTALLAAVPATWPIGAQVVRTVGGVFLLAWFSGELRRPWFCGWAGSVDILIGLTALPLAWWVSSGSPAASAVAVGWALLGLLDFVVAIVVINVDRTVVPDFFAAHGPVVTAIRPVILVIFSYAVPLASILHLATLWRLG